MTILTTQIQSLLRPGLKAVFGSYPKYPSIWSKLFETYTSDKSAEYETEMKLLPIAQFKAEGAPVAFADMSQRFITSYVHRYLALGFQISAQAIDDNLYKDKFPIMVRALRDSMAQAKEVLGAAVFNNAFDGNFPIGDGQPVCSTTHPIDTGVVANRFSIDADLNEATLEAAVIGMQQFRDQAGLLVMTKPMKLAVSPQGQFTAERILESKFRPGTPNNDIGVFNHMGLIPQGIVVNHYFTIPNAWFLLSDAPNSFKHYIRNPIKTDVYTEFNTENLLAKAVERYSFGVSNFRGVFGSRGT